MRPILALTLVAALLAAGCLGSPESEPPTGLDAVKRDAATWDAVRALMADVPCEAAVSTTATSDNLLPLGEFTTESGHYGEMDARGDVLAIGAGQALEIMDVFDPRAPVLLGSLPLEISTADVKWLPGMDAVVIGAYEGQLVVVDVKDPSAMAIVGEADVATQAHMVMPAALDGKTYIYVASQSSNQPAFVYELEGTTPKLVGEFGFAPGPLASGPLGNHDITILHDEMLDKPTLYLADGTNGWSAWSLDDPVAPQRIGFSLGQEGGAGYVHTIRVGFFDGKRIVATMQEVGQNTLKIYDATDLTRPVLLARWNADPARPTIPQHNIQLLGDLLFIGHYTEGVYVFNLSAVIAGPPLVGTLEMQPIAHYAIESPDDGGALGFANIWDVVVRRGIIYATDISGTLSSVGFGCLSIGDEAATATL